jgi:alkylhydroperoxidase family enzyme
LVRRGLTEDEVEAAVGDLDAAIAAERLPAKTIAALRLVDVLTADHPAIDGPRYDELRADFDEGELLELSAAIVIASGWQRMIEAYGIRPDHWTEATPLPWQASPPDPN